jgi:hypothetical protein
MVPSHFLETLIELYRSNAIFSLKMSRELDRICKQFQDEQVTIVPFKGPIFGEFAYGDLCLRPFCDLDFLVNKQDIARAKALLLADGYELEFDIDRTRETAFLRQECEYTFINHRKQISVDLHWGIVRNYASFGLSVDEILKHLIPFEFFGRQIMIPSPEYTLLILILHNGGKHQWEGLLGIFDVAQLISSRKDLDWDKVINIAAEKGMSRALHLGLYLAQDLLSVELPASVSRRMQDDSTIKSVAAQISTRLFASAESPPTKLEHLLFSLNTRARAVDKIRYCLAQLVTSDHEDRNHFALPQALVPIYGLLRLARWLRN